MIQTKCASCGKVYKLPDQAAGKKAKCKACGKVMSIPAAVETADPLGLGGASDSAKGDLSSLYGDAGHDPVAPPETEPVGFNPSVSFSNTPRGSSGPPMKLIIGGVGGAVALILVVVVAMSLLGGGDDDAGKDEQGGDGLALDGGSVPSGTANSPDPTTDNPNSDPDDDDDDDDDQGTDEQAVRMLPESPASVIDWTLAIQPQQSERLLKAVSFRGMQMHVPSGWEMMNANEDFAEVGFAADAMDPGLFIAVLREHHVGINVMTFSPSARPEGDWPEVIQATVMDHTMFGQEGLYTEEDKPEELPEIAFDAQDPHRIYLKKNAVLDVSYGTLFEGYPFIRMEIDPQNVIALPDSPKPTRLVVYAGYLGDMFVLFRLDVTRESNPYLPGLEAIVRSARLMSREQAKAAAEKDASYLALIELDDREAVFDSDPRPMPGKRAAEGGSIDSLLALVKALKPAAGLVAPTGKDFGIEMPEALEVISTTRSSVRCKPLDDGFWLSMEVHKLAGLERRQASALAEGGGSILVRGRAIPLPDGAELSEIESDAYTIQRLLYPASGEQGLRRVEYVVKDGAYLITVLGRFPADQPQRLAELDAAAMSVRPIVKADADN